MKDTLGLPLEYKELPEFFDASNINETTDAKNAVIKKILQKYNVKTVLDLTCGTGSQVFYLAQHGYDVTGADFSPDLLKIARNKAKQNNIDVTFIDGDMRTLSVGQFDAVITIFNAIGHVTKTDFEKTLQNIHNNLKDGGIYVFDIFNLAAITDEIISDFATFKHAKINDVHIHTIQYSTIDYINGILTSYDTYVTQKNADKPERFSNTFALQIYTAHEVRELLNKNGFDLLKHYEMDGSEFIENKTINMLTVAQKRKD